MAFFLEIQCVMYTISMLGKVCEKCIFIMNLMLTTQSKNVGTGKAKKINKVKLWCTQMRSVSNSP